MKVNKGVVNSINFFKPSDTNLPVFGNTDDLDFLIKKLSDARGKGANRVALIKEESNIRITTFRFVESTEAEHNAMLIKEAESRLEYLKKLTLETENNIRELKELK